MDQEAEKKIDLEKSIRATIAYYDYFNYPLTAAEIYHYLINSEGASGISKPKFPEILDVLDNSEQLKKSIGEKNGFYFLSGKEEIVAARIQRKKLADQKFKRSKWILKVISFMPFVRFLAISGSMGLGNPHDKSDIDLLIIAKEGRIWTARAFLTFFSLLLGKYRHTGKTEDRLCLNHYITDKSLFIDFGNLYKAQEYLNLLPIAGKMKIYDEFFSANKDWLWNYAYPDPDMKLRPGLLYIAYGNFLSGIKRSMEYLLSGSLGSRLERRLKEFQIYFIKRNPLNNMAGAVRDSLDSAAHSRIKYSDASLVFHPILVEPEVITEYNKKVAC